MTGEVVAVLVAAAVVGGAVQATLGFGGSFVLVPAVAVLAPDALPAAVLLGLLPMTSWIAWRDRAALDRAAFVRISVARVPGILLATAVVALAPQRVLTLVIAAVLLVAVAANAAGWSIRPTRAAQGLVGAVSGFTGIAAALGGPPLALLYRHASGADRRGTLSAVFTIGIVLGLAMLAGVGEFGTADVPTGLLLGAGLTGGALLMAPVTQRLSDELLRRALLGWAAVGAVAAVVRSLV